MDASTNSPGLWLLRLALAYLGVGIAAAAVMHASVLRRIDPASTRSGWGFKLIITPGLVALWPLLLAAWAATPEERISPTALRAAHRWMWLVLSLAVPAGLALALWWRPAIHVPGRIDVPATAVR